MCVYICIYIYIYIYMYASQVIINFFRGLRRDVLREDPRV